MKKLGRLGAVAAAVAGAAVAVGSALSSGADATAPSSSQSPYVVAAQPGLVTEALLTVGDGVNAKPDGTPYRMVGIPDGLGAYDNGDGTFTVLMNHELGAGSGIVRAHGSRGAFVSKWTLRKDTLAVLHGEDLIQQVMLWNGSGYTPGTTAFDRFCSGDLPAQAALWDAASGKGFAEPLYLSGEEAGNEGRAFAHELDGTSWQLPFLGRFSWENAVASPYSGETTAVVGLDDSSPGQVYLYVGRKSDTGNPVERAGLNGGRLFGLRIPGVASETNTTTAAPGTRFELVDLGVRAGSTGVQLEADSNAAAVTRFLRPEDGSFDPTDPRYFYFVTTNAFNARSKLWRLAFDDPRNPAAGGTIETVLDGTEGQQMLDNMTVAENGDALLQEDPGNQSHLARIWRYVAATDTLVEVARHDVNRFLSGAPGFLTQDEESSGIVPVPFLGEETYLLDVQAHVAVGGGELVQGGQLLLLQWMDFANLAALVDRTVAGEADRKLLKELLRAAKEESKGKAAGAGKRLDRFEDELAKLVGRGALSWEDGSLLARLANDIRP